MLQGSRQQRQQVGHRAAHCTQQPQQPRPRAKTRRGKDDLQGAGRATADAKEQLEAAKAAAGKRRRDSDSSADEEDDSGSVREALRGVLATLDAKKRKGADVARTTTSHCETHPYKL